MIRFLREIFCKSDQILELINTFDLLLNKDDFSANDGVDLNSHIDIFHSIYSQVIFYNIFQTVSYKQFLSNKKKLGAVNESN